MSGKEPRARSALVAGLYDLAIVAVASLVGLKLAAVWFPTLIRKQRHAGAWSPLLTLFVLSMVSCIAFRSSQPAAVT